MRTPRLRVILIACLLAGGVAGRLVSPAAAGADLSDTVRFLEQATFGPSPDLIAHVQEVGLEVYLAEQFALPAPVLPRPDNWPQKPPDTCTGTCLRDNYSTYPLQ